MLPLLMLAGIATACGGGAGSTPPPPQSPTCIAVPTAPSALVATSVTAGSAVLSWTGATPANCSLAFGVYQNDARVGPATAKPTLKVTGLAPGTTYQFTVDATDAAGTSPKSPPLTVTTSTGGTVFNGITLTGKLLWHSYSNYGFTGVKSWMANFDTGEVYDITATRLLGAMNYHFSPDGTSVVVMADDNAVTTINGTTAWDLWIASVTETGLANITKITDAAMDGSRNEDPKFSSDGTRIIFKRNLTSIMSIDVAAIAVNGVDQTPPQTQLLASPTEVSMPYYMTGSTSSFLYADDATKSIRQDAAGTVSTLYAIGTHSYYPIAIDQTRFYFAAGQSSDWIYRGDTSGGTASAAAFITAANSTSEFADPFPMAGDWLVYTSTAPDGSGGYDIWVGNFQSGQSFNLNNWIRAANHANSDLGPAFHGSVAP